MAIADFGDRVEAAKRTFKSRNRKDSRTFDVVKVHLHAMCNHTARCVYCEDNYADEVEHIRPKDLYPEQCFAWDNYVYACGPCNGPKNNHFAVFDDAGVEHDVTPPRKRRGEPTPPRQPPIPGAPLLIDPRVEDPMHFLVLDLASGGLAPHPERDASDRRRAEWTRDTLGLNKRRLPRARVQRVRAFRACLKEYADDKEAGADLAALQAAREAILGMDHQTVLREMWRQRSFEPDLAALFLRVPEVGTWW